MKGRESYHDVLERDVALLFLIQTPEGQAKVPVVYLTLRQTCSNEVVPMNGGLKTDKYSEKWLERIGRISSTFYFKGRKALSLTSPFRTRMAVRYSITRECVKTMIAHDVRYRVHAGLLLLILQHTIENVHHLFFR